MKKLLLYGFLGLVMSNCQPEIELPNQQLQENSPVFSMNGYLDGIPFSWQAGINTRFMTTELTQLSNGLYELEGRIEPTPCVNCPEVMTVILRDFKVSPPESSLLIDSTLQLKNYPFQRNTGTNNLHNVTFNGQSTGAAGTTAVLHIWLVRDSTGSPIDTLVGLNPTTILPIGNYRVSLTSTFSNSCSNTIEQNLLVDPNGLGCSVDFTVNRVPGSTLVQFVPVNINVPVPFSLRWEINGQVTFGQSAVIVVDSMSVPAVFPVILTVSSATCTVVVKKHISNDPNLHCAANFRVGGITLAEDPNQFGHVRIEYRDKLGKLYSSVYRQQPSWANFTITQLTDYLRDNSGKPTKAVSAGINCMLFEENGTNSLELREGQFRFALPYK